jgi:hypothetical protein
MSESTVDEGGAMDLQTFVSETLWQLFEGTKAAITRGVQVASMSGHREVQFDIAVTVVQGTGKKGGAGIFVGAIGIGGQATSEATNTSISRIKFSVPVHLPGSDE